jgi:O-methyltransferase involved in polyketide biosynthesis
MISASRGYAQTQPWVVAGPGLAIGLTMLAASLANSLQGCAIRPAMFDESVQELLSEHPGVKVVEIGGGLNGRFELDTATENLASPALRH